MKAFEHFLWSIFEPFDWKLEPDIFVTKPLSPTSLTGGLSATHANLKIQIEKLPRIHIFKKLATIHIFEKLTKIHILG